MQDRSTLKEATKLMLISFNSHLVLEERQSGFRNIFLYNTITVVIVTAAIKAMMQTITIAAIAPPESEP